MGNLRTAILAWLFARSTGRRFLLRIEDLDRVRDGAEARQRHDLAAIGLDWDEPTIHQSSRIALYDSAIDSLSTRGLTYECYCTRREILDAASAPHAPDGAYPGTCRALTDAQRDERRAAGRHPALRLAAQISEFDVHDILHGNYTGTVDDVVLRRGDGVPAYNLAVVVDDGAQGIEQVVRGDDLLSSAPRQAYLATLLNLPIPTYAHVPLALSTDGKRLAKRDGAVTLADHVARGHTPVQVLGIVANSLGLAAAHESVNLETLLTRFDPTRLPLQPWIFPTT